MININGIGVVVLVKLFALSPCLPSLWLGIPIVIFPLFFPFSFWKSSGKYIGINLAHRPVLFSNGRLVVIGKPDSQIESNMKARSRKEVFQPHLPVRLPCYDLAPITSFALGRSLRSRTSGAPGFHGLTGGVYKARERIHRAVADARFLANPASWSRVADSNPN